MACHLTGDIIWTNAGILLIGPVGTNFCEMLTEIYTFSVKKKCFENVVWKMAAILPRPQCVNETTITVFSGSYICYDTCSKYQSTATGPYHEIWLLQSDSWVYDYKLLICMYVFAYIRWQKSKLNITDPHSCRKNANIRVSNSDEYKNSVMPLCKVDCRPWGYV